MDLARQSRSARPPRRGGMCVIVRFVPILADIIVETVDGRLDAPEVNRGAELEEVLNDIAE